MLMGRLFIIDGIISLPIALAGFVVLPDVPEIAKPFYLSKKVRGVLYIAAFLTLTGGFFCAAAYAL